MGDGCISKHPKTYRLRITLDNKHPEIQKECIESLEILFPDNKIGSVKRIGSLDISVYNKNLPSLFPQHSSGKKHLRKITLEQCQKDIALENPKQFFLGLLHSDGCHYFRGERLCYGFANKSKDINDLFIWICKSLNIETNSHFYSKKKIYRTEIAKRGSVAIAREIAGFKK